MISRDNATVEPQILDSANQPTAYGVPVAIDATSHKLRAIKAADTAAVIYGLLVRPFPFQSSNNDFGSDAGVPTSGVVDVMKRGYMTVKLNGATASANGGAVYVRVANAATGKPIGGIEAAADSTNTVVMANAEFTGAADSDGNVEVAYNL
jgi:hypothetical protein